MQLEEMFKQIKEPQKTVYEEAMRRWDSIAKPLRSLGELEINISKIAAMIQTAELAQIQLSKKALVIMCADHGVVEEGVTQTGAEVTAIVAEHFTTGRASVNAMAGVVGVDLFPVDIGMCSEKTEEKKNLLEEELQQFRLCHARVAEGSANITKQAAMTQEQCEQALLTGIEIVRILKARGYHIIATGEMGIGNTTPSGAVAAVLLQEDVNTLTGRGAGLSDAGLEKKIQVIQRAVKRFQDTYFNSCSRESYGLCLLRELGGYDIAGMTGLFLGGALYHVPIVIDGLISSVAAALACEIAPSSRHYMLASHVSREPAGQKMLDYIGLKPLLTCGMSLGEGSGAIAALPLLDMALAVYQQMDTFTEAGVTPYENYGQGQMRNN